MSAYLNDPDAPPHLTEFLSSIDTDRLCASASVLRSGFDCHVGELIIGGYNALFEIIFADNVTWFARCPLPYACSSTVGSDNLMYSYAAALKYIKLHTSIPVPEVLACCSGSDKENDVGVSYMLMKRIPGRTLDLQDVDEDEEGYEPTRTAAVKVFRQLAGFVMQLASLQFDEIGNLQQRFEGNGTFLVGEYFDSGILYPPERGKIYEASSFKGPFSTVSEYHSALLSLNEKFAAVDDDDEDGEYWSSVQQCRLLRPKISLLKYEKGPFVLNHDDLSSGNILVDDDYNITGILDFPGTIVPLPALCVFPAIIKECNCTPFTDQNLWLQCIREALPVPGSVLNGPEERKLLMDSAQDRGNFHTALSHTYAFVTIAPMAKRLGIEKSSEEEIRHQGWKGYEVTGAKTSLPDDGESQG